LPGYLGGDVEEADVDGGDAEEEGGLEVEELIGGLPVLEALEQAHAAARDQPAVEAVAEAVDVEQREREQEAVFGGDAPAGEEVEGVGAEVVVGEHGSLGGPGGAGGIDDGGGGVAGEARRRARGLHLRGILELVRTCDEEFGFGIANDVGDFTAAVEDVDGDKQAESFVQSDRGMVRAPERMPPNITPESLPEQRTMRPVGPAGRPPISGTSRQGINPL